MIKYIYVLILTFSIGFNELIIEHLTIDGIEICLQDTPLEGEGESESSEKFEDGEKIRVLDGFKLLNYEEFNRSSAYFFALRSCQNHPELHTPPPES